MCSKSSDAKALTTTVTDALRSGDPAAAEKKLKTLVSREPLSACTLNLFGILSEIRGERESARKYYLAAYIFDGSYTPAFRNLERVTSLHSHFVIDYGDVPEKSDSEKDSYEIIYDKKHIGHVARK
jgi:hypothetical protein